MKRWTLDFDKFKTLTERRKAQDEWVGWWLDWLLLYVRGQMGMLEDQLETRVLAYCALFYKETRVGGATTKAQGKAPPMGELVGQYVGQYAKGKNGVSPTDALFARMGKDVDKRYGAILSEITNRFADGARQMYGLACYETQRELGEWANVRNLTEEQLAKIADAEWFDGQRFSDRLWDDKLVLERALRRVLVQGINLGWNAERMALELGKALNAAYYVLERLVRTEANRVQNMALAQAYKANGVRQYEYVAILDERTSEVCQELNGRVFNVADAEPGVNMPPMHPNCRSSTIPIAEGDKKIDADLRRLDYDNWAKGFLG